MRVLAWLALNFLKLGFLRKIREGSNILGSWSVLCGNKISGVDQRGSIFLGKELRVISIQTKETVAETWPLPTVVLFEIQVNIMKFTK